MTILYTPIPFSLLTFHRPYSPFFPAPLSITPNHISFFSTTIILCSPSQLNGLSSTIPSSKLQTTFATSNLISAHASGFPMQPVGPTLNGWHADSLSPWNSCGREASGSQRSRMKSKGWAKLEGERKRA